jgi:hypothetical protein
MTRFAIVPLLAVCGGLAGAAALQADAFPHQATAAVRESYTLAAVEGRRFLLIDNVTGSVTVRAGAGDRVEVAIAQTFRAATPAALERARREARLTVESEPGKLALVQDGPFRCDRSSHRFLCDAFEDEREWEVEFDWTVTVPASLDLEVRNVNGGEVSVAGVRGRIRAANVNDAVSLAEVAGDVSASTVNGPLTVTFAALPASDMEFSSVNGEVDLAFPKGFGAELYAKTLNGEVLTDFPHQTLAPRRVAAAEDPQHGPRRRFEAGAIRIGAGGPKLQCSTVNGDILIRERG